MHILYRLGAEDFLLARRPSGVIVPVIVPGKETWTLAHEVMVMVVGLSCLQIFTGILLLQCPT